jgi:hypothetical protein
MHADVYARFTPIAPFFTSFLQGAGYSSYRNFGSCRAAVCLTSITAARGLQHKLSIRMNLQGVNMDDLLYLGLTLAFFALSVALVYALEKLRRPQ